MLCVHVLLSRIVIRNTYIIYEDTHSQRRFNRRNKERSVAHIFIAAKRERRDTRTHANNTNKQIIMYKMVWCRCPGFINWHSFAFSLLFFSYREKKRKERKMPKRRQCELERRNEWIENDWRDRGRVKAGLTNFSSRQRVLYFFLANLTNPVAQKYILFMLPYTHSHTHRLCWAIIFGGRCTLFVVLFAVVKHCMWALDANFFFHCRSRRCRRRCSRRFLAGEGLLTWLDIDIYTTVCLLLLLSHITCMRLWRFYKKKKNITFTHSNLSEKRILRDESIRI